MTQDAREALASLRFNWAETPDDVWSTSPYHVDGIHQEAEQAVRAGIKDAVGSNGPSPIGIVLRGQKGVGKTHLLGWVRREVQGQGGYFFLVALSTGTVFWSDVVQHVLSGLMKTDDDGERQLTRFLRSLCSLTGTPDSVANAIVGDTSVSADDLDAFVTDLFRLDRAVGKKCADTARALVLYASSDMKKSEIGEDYFDGFDEPEREARDKWGIRPTLKPVHEIAQEIFQLLALTGASVIAVDQLDTLVARATDKPLQSDDDPKLAGELSLIADGLMQLRERTRRTLSLVACLPYSWHLLSEKAVDSVSDRFRTTKHLDRIIDPERGREFVRKWLGVPYAKIGFTPPHPTWPVSPTAFETWDTYRARELLKRIDAHVESCLRGEIHELKSFDAEVEVLPTQPTGPEPAYFAELDKRFAQLRAEVDVSTPLDEHTEDRVMPAYLSAALRSWITEVGNDDMVWKAEPPPEGKSVVHAAIRRTLDEEYDIEEHWAFRAIAARHHLSALHRIRNARSAAGVRATADNRHLVLIRNKPWSPGTKTQQELAEFQAKGGKDVRISEDDLRTFGALTEMLTTQSYDLREWLVSRKPASSSTLLADLLPTTPPERRFPWPAADPDTRESNPHDPHVQPAQPTSSTGTNGSSHTNGRHAVQTLPQPPESPPLTVQAATTLHTGTQRPATPTSQALPPSATTITLGVDQSVSIELESLRKHAVVFAGSGSGKTVLIRRIVEECALRGVSAIVLDPNNDLARLGDPWPSPPADWAAGDAEAAGDYLDNTDVVVWTPGRASGRPLSFHPLPDFAGVLDDEDEFTAAVEVAVAALAPHAKVTGAANKAVRGKAVLREALTHYARKGSRGMLGFIDLLTDLPDGVSRLGSGHPIAADLAENLKAAMVNDPLFAGAGEPADPAVLFTPAPGKRARVSVISFIGLPADEQKQAFVNQLQMEIFAWIKRNPAGDRPLGGLLVMDEAQTLAPSGGVTASTRSTIVLASQARKYGLGLLFATQAPKGLHNQITGNATTQFFGRLNSPAQIAAANEMARAKGTTLDDISGLNRGQFYVTGDTFAFRRMRSPLCLTHHPASPLRIEEVLERARNSQP
ncbi:ATP-binding protein [Actinophytocola glycyrrhizae]|uniref:Helicase HerA domain-containing protein n=1 Tax=Actinophytocola glycyrrhizae TaxID=2044873 RepID=A0ABV9SCD1_9PSEU